jgi:KDO2-lipid IV(A) lauroyltransferase
LTLPLCLTPRFIRLKFGYFLGFIFYYLSPRHRNITLKNLRIAFTDKDDKWIKKTAHSSFSFFGKMVTDIVCASSLTKNRIKNIVTSAEGLENLDEARKKGMGALCMAFHFGNWELLALGASFYGYDVAVVARRLDNPFLENTLLKSRTPGGSKVIHKKNAFKNMITFLKQNYLIGLLIDQNQIAKEGIFVDYFGKKASTTPSLAMLAIKYNIPVIPSYCIPIESNRYKLVFDKPIEFSKTGNFSEDVNILTQKCTTYIEELVKKYPVYWLWMHKRWKTRPDGEKPIY